MLKIQLDHLLVLGMLSAAVHWFVARSLIMKWFWARTRGWLAKLLVCPACSGWWISFGLGWLGIHPVAATWMWLSAVFAGVLGIILTPVFEGLLLWGLAVSTIETPTPDAEAAAPAPTTELHGS